MSRVVRINELLKRELSDLLHTRYRDRAVGITVTEVDVTPDLRSARVYYSVLGDTAARREADALFREARGDLRSRVGKAVILKYTPAFEFVYDDSFVRGNRTLSILDELAAKGEFEDTRELLPEDEPEPETESEPEGETESEA